MLELAVVPLTIQLVEQYISYTMTFLLCLIGNHNREVDSVYTFQ